MMIIGRNLSGEVLRMKGYEVMTVQDWALLGKMFVGILIFIAGVGFGCVAHAFFMNPESWFENEKDGDSNAK